MHILTGILLTTLLGRKSKRVANSHFLNLTWPIETKHVLPGRIRFCIPAIIGDSDGTKRVTDQLPRLEGVTSVEVNSISGSVLIHYQASIIAPELLFAALIRLLGLEREFERAPQSAIARELKNIGNALNRAIFTQTNGILDLWTAVPLVLLGLGIKKLATERPRTLPTGFTLVWWAYMALFAKQKTTDR